MRFGHNSADIAVDAEAVEQNCKSRLLLLQGEWFLNSNDGVPWLPQIMEKPADLPLAESLIKKQILETDGVKENGITAFDISLDHQTRRADITATVETNYGAVPFGAAQTI
jgi:hypothetical protein